MGQAWAGVWTPNPLPSRNLPSRGRGWSPTPGPMFHTLGTPVYSESASHPLGTLRQAYLSLHARPSLLGLLRREKGQHSPCGEMAQLMPERLVSQRRACLVPKPLPQLE